MDSLSSLKGLLFIKTARLESFDIFEGNLST